ncbi:LPP leucine zipper domain-containing protein, partial [Salmonella enterica subsp. enterica serovar Infantis]
AQLSSAGQTLCSIFVKLCNDVKVLRSDVQAAKYDAARANQRLDNKVVYHVRK